VRESGLPAASTQLLTVDGRRVLVSERFDRVGAWPTVERLHQEDFTQLTGRLAIHKYEQHGGPNVAECLEAILDRSADPIRDRRVFLETVWVNALLGNADAHAKNYALLLKERAWRLAPAYDVVCTLVYGQVDHGAAMRLDGQTSGRWADLDYLTSSQLSNGLHSWGYRGRSRRQIAARLVELAGRVQDCATPERLPLDELSDDEHRHVRLMSREIGRRANALRYAASGIE
jgi:serine/threonine-protein kinase HipA